MHSQKDCFHCWRSQMHTNPQLTCWNARPWWKLWLGKLHTHSSPWRKNRKFDLQHKVISITGFISQFFFFSLSRGLCGDDRLSIRPYLNIYFWGEDRSSRPAELPGLSLADWQQGAFHLALDHALSHALSKLAIQQFPIKAKWQYIDLLRPAT